MDASEVRNDPFSAGQSSLQRSPPMTMTGNHEHGGKKNEENFAEMSNRFVQSYSRHPYLMTDQPSTAIFMSASNQGMIPPSNAAPQAGSDVGVLDGISTSYSSSAKVPPLSLIHVSARTLDPSPVMLPVAFEGAERLMSA